MNGTPHLLIFVAPNRIRELIRGAKMKKKKARKNINVELSIVMWENHPYLSNVTVKDKDKNLNKKNVENLTDLCFRAYVLKLPCF